MQEQGAGSHGQCSVSLCVTLPIVPSDLACAQHSDNAFPVCGVTSEAGGLDNLNDNFLNF